MPPHPARRRRLASHLPLKGKAKGKAVFLPVDFSAHSVSVRRFSLLSCANSLPLEGKVSAEPTDEVENPATDIPNAIKNASAEATISNIAGRAVAKTTTWSVKTAIKDTWRP